MTQQHTGSEASQKIDLTKETDVLYWCRIFDVSMQELREAVHAVGHDAKSVERHLRQARPTDPGDV